MACSRTSESADLQLEVSATPREAELSGGSFRMGGQLSWPLQKLRKNYS